MGKPERTVLAIGIAVLLVIVVSAGVTVAFGSPDVTEFEDGRPEATLQRYLAAAHDNDPLTMESLLSERILRDREREPLSPDFCTETDDRIVVVDRVVEDGDSAVIYLKIEQFDASLFGSGRSDWRQETRLVREDGAWKIDDPYFCV